MQAEGCPFKGCLYFGLMLTPDGPKVIEYNCRFGDPETQVVLPLLESDLLTVMEATTNGTLDKTDVKFSDGAAACVILASGGYPLAYEKGKEITCASRMEPPGCTMAVTPLRRARSMLSPNGKKASLPRLTPVTAFSQARFSSAVSGPAAR